MRQAAGRCRHLHQVCGVVFITDDDLAETLGRNPQIRFVDLVARRVRFELDVDTDGDLIVVLVRTGEADFRVVLLVHRRPVERVLASSVLDVGEADIVQNHPLLHIAMDSEFEPVGGLGLPGGTEQKARCRERGRAVQKLFH